MAAGENRDRAVAFLDLLGFRSYLKEDLEGAVELLRNYRAMLVQKLGDTETLKQTPPPTQELAALGDQMAADSFEHAIPFSDSLFLVSREPDKFLLQTAKFLLDCYTFTAPAYMQPDDPKNPTCVTVKEVGSGPDGHVKVQSRVEHWYPTLFRGGVSYGQVVPAIMIGIDIYKPVKVTNVTGTAVVRAVSMEKSGSGPRVFCDRSFVGSLSEPVAKQLISEVKPPELYELLWPALHFQMTSSLPEAKSKLEELLVPVARLWQPFSAVEEERHYREFMRLVVRSAGRFFKSQSYSANFTCTVSAVLKSVGLQVLAQDLLQSVGA